MVPSWRHAQLRDTDEDEHNFIADLKSGHYDALLLDDSFLGYTALYDPNCQLYTVGQAFETFSLAMGFPSDFDDEAVKAWSRWVAQLCSKLHCQVGAEAHPLPAGAGLQVITFVGARVRQPAHRAAS